MDLSKNCNSARLYSQNHLNWSWMSPEKIHLRTFSGLLKCLCLYTSTSVFCKYPIPTFKQKEWPLAQMVLNQQIYGGLASTTEKVSPYSYYLPLAQLSETTMIWANTAISINIHAGKWEANFSFIRWGLCIASTSLLAHTPETLNTSHQETGKTTTSDCSAQAECI